QGMILGNSAIFYRVNYKFKTSDKHTSSKKAIAKSDYQKIKPEIYISANQVNNIEKIKQIAKAIIEHSNDDLIIGNWDDFIDSFNISIGGHIDIKLTEGNNLDLKKAINHNQFGENAYFISGSGEFINRTSNIDEHTFIVEREVEKMSKSKYNVVNP